MLRIIVEEVFPYIVTDYGRWVRKLRIQCQRGVLTPRVRSLEMSLDGLTVLKQSYNQ